MDTDVKSTPSKKPRTNKLDKSRADALDREFQQTPSPAKRRQHPVPHAGHLHLLELGDAGSFLAHDSTGEVMKINPDWGPVQLLFHNGWGILKRLESLVACCCFQVCPDMKILSAPMNFIISNVVASKAVAPKLSS